MLPKEHSKSVQSSTCKRKNGNEGGGSKCNTLTSPSLLHVSHSKWQFTAKIKRACYHKDSTPSKGSSPKVCLKMFKSKNKSQREKENAKALSVSHSLHPPHHKLKVIKKG